MSTMAILIVCLSAIFVAAAAVLVTLFICIAISESREDREEWNDL